MHCRPAVPLAVVVMCVYIKDCFVNSSVPPRIITQWTEYRPNNHVGPEPSFVLQLCPISNSYFLFMVNTSQHHLLPVLSIHQRQLASSPNRHNIAHTWGLFSVAQFKPLLLHRIGPHRDFQPNQNPPQTHPLRAPEHFFPYIWEMEKHVKVVTLLCNQNKRSSIQKVSMSSAI